MRHRGVVRIVWAAIVSLLLTSGSSASAEVSLGASFGYTHLSYRNTAQVTNNVFGVPGTQEWGQPGLRVGYLAPGDRWNVNIDVGLVHRFGSIGMDETTFQLLPQFQFNEQSRGGVIPFFSGGLGVQHETAVVSSSTSVTATRPVLSVGLGVRKSVSHGNGLVRIELDYAHLFDQVVEIGPSTTLTFPTTSVISVKLGFDLLVVKESSQRP